jgi:hypothetical protein
VALYTYVGPQGGHYSYLHTRHGVAPFSDLSPGDIVDFAEHEPPDDERWRTTKHGFAATRVPDNAPALPLAPAFSDAPDTAADQPPRRARPARSAGS